jgi:hypothetical protein
VVVTYRQRVTNLHKLLKNNKDVTSNFQFLLKTKIYKYQQRSSAIQRKKFWWGDWKEEAADIGEKE